MNEFLQLTRAAFRMSSGLDATEASPDSRYFNMARRHRIAGLWADAFESLDDNWKTSAYGQALHSARLTEEAARVFEALRGSVEGLRLVKGPALSQQAWPRDGLRSFDDLDFRCEKASLPALTDGLASLGYQVKAENDTHRDNLWHFGWGLEFFHPDGTMVEVNHRMFPPHFPWPERLSRLASGFWVSGEFEGTRIPVPSAALHLLLACVHAAWHAWARLGWMVDIAGLMVRHPAARSEAKAMVSPGAFAGRALAAGCGIASELFGLEAGSSALTEQAVQLLMREESHLPAETIRQVHRELMSPVELGRYNLRRLATPGDPDFRRWGFSGARRVFYWPLRPLRRLGL